MCLKFDFACFGRLKMARWAQLALLAVAPGMTWTQRTRRTRKTRRTRRTRRKIAGSRSGAQGWHKLAGLWRSSQFQPGVFFRLFHWRGPKSRFFIQTYAHQVAAMIYRCCYGPSFCQLGMLWTERQERLQHQLWPIICRQIIDKRFRSHSPKKVGFLSSSTPFSRLAGGSRQDRFVVSTACLNPCCTLAVSVYRVYALSRFTASLPKSFRLCAWKIFSWTDSNPKKTASQGNSQYISALQASNLDAKARRSKHSEMQTVTIY